MYEKHIDRLLLLNCFSMSPSRLLAIMDPLLNTGFLWRCLAAYSGIKSDQELSQDEPSTETSIPMQSLPSLPTKEDNFYARLGEFSLFIYLSIYLSISIDEYTIIIFFPYSGEIMGTRQASLLKKLRESTLSSQPYMSPLFASDEILQQFPMTYLIVSIQQ
jgi:hypothetical protein